MPLINPVITCVFFILNEIGKRTSLKVRSSTGLVLYCQWEYFMPSGLQTCLCSLLEPAQWLLGKLVFVFWGQRYTCARALVCPLGFWRKESSSPSMSVLFQRCLLSKQWRWSWASGTRHKERRKKKKEGTCSPPFPSKHIFCRCISISHQSFYSSSSPFWVGVTACLMFLEWTPALCRAKVHVKDAALYPF